MTTAEPNAHAGLAAEMWISLQALVASHAAMHSIARPKDALSIAVNTQGVTVKGAHGTLRWTAPDASGAGEIEIDGPGTSAGNRERGRYEFTEDGFLRLDHAVEALELEAVVEQQLQKLQGQKVQG
jgi:hypothetical protein